MSEGQIRYGMVLSEPKARLVCVCLLVAKGRWDGERDVCLSAAKSRCAAREHGIFIEGEGSGVCVTMGFSENSSPRRMELR